MKVVFLDSDSLPVSIARPAWVTDWQDRPDTTPDQVVAAARNADAISSSAGRAACISARCRSGQRKGRPISSFSLVTVPPAWRLDLN